MTYKLDWAAPVEPGVSILGLQIGMPADAVYRLFGCDGGSERHEITFENSPRLIVDTSKQGVITLRAVDCGKVNYSWQDEVADLIFEGGVLAFVRVDMIFGLNDELYRYKGKIFGKLGLGSQVAEMLEFAPLEYDDAEEVFYSDHLIGLELAGSTACDLTTDPSQPITTIRVFSLKHMRLNE